MQSSELQQRYSRIEQYISDAAQACQQSASAPEDLKDSLQQLNARRSEVRQIIQGQDEDRSRDAICRARWDHPKAVASRGACSFEPLPAMLRMNGHHRTRRAAHDLVGDAP